MDESKRPGDDERDGGAAEGLREPEQTGEGERRPIWGEGEDESGTDLDVGGEVAGVADDAIADDEPVAEVAASGVRSDPRYATDRAVKAGYPPDFGPEERVMFVRAAFFRAKLASSIGLVSAPIVLGLVGYWLGGASGARVGLWTFGVTALVCWVWLVGWWFWATRSRAMEITNKRTVEMRGLFSRTRDEVLHDHIRNVTVHQSLYDRVVRIGRVGIASSGQDRTEIEMDDLPSPRKIREVIDLYRPLD